MQESTKCRPAWLHVAAIKQLVILILTHDKKNSNKAYQHQNQDAHVDPKVVLNKIHHVQLLLVKEPR